MLGSELKKIRKKYRLTQKQFAKKLGTTNVYLSRMETGLLEITPNIIKALSEKQKKKYTIIKTDKVFSRDLFLKDMLTGNEVIDDIYINADWLYKLDGKKVSIRRTEIALLNDKNEEIEVLRGIEQYIIEYNNIFYPKKEWIRSIVL